MTKVILRIQGALLIRQLPMDRIIFCFWSGTYFDVLKRQSPQYFHMQPHNEASYFGWSRVYLLLSLTLKS